MSNKKKSSNNKKKSTNSSGQKKQGGNVVYNKVPSTDQERRSAALKEANNNPIEPKTVENVVETPSEKNEVFFGGSSMGITVMTETTTESFAPCESTDLEPVSIEKQEVKSTIEEPPKDEEVVVEQVEELQKKKTELGFETTLAPDLNKPEEEPLKVAPIEPVTTPISKFNKLLNERNALFAEVGGAINNRYKIEANMADMVVLAHEGDVSVLDALTNYMQQYPHLNGGYGCNIVKRGWNSRYAKSLLATHSMLTRIAFAKRKGTHVQLNESLMAEIISAGVTSWIRRNI